MKFTATIYNNQNPCKLQKALRIHSLTNKHSHEHYKYCSEKEKKKTTKKPKAFSFSNTSPQFFRCVTLDSLKTPSLLYFFINTVLTHLVTHRGVCPSGTEGRWHMRLGFLCVFILQSKQWFFSLLFCALPFEYKEEMGAYQGLKKVFLSTNCPPTP